jgi:hypothetical protein
VDDGGTGTVSFSLSVFPGSIPVNGTSTVFWETEGAGSCWKSGGWNGWMSDPLENGLSVETLMETTTYRITCWTEDNRILPKCLNGVDDDNDGYFDGHDADCDNAFDSDEDE